MILWYIFISVKGSSSTWIWVYHYLNIDDWSWKEISKEHSYNFFQIVTADTSEANFQRQLWVSQMKTHYEARIYITGTSQSVLKKHDITVVNKPLITLQQQFPAPKFRPSLESQTNVVYKIPCGDCSWCYIGETGRAFNTRKKEHLRNVKTAAKGSRIANHVWANSHAIDFDNASIIDKGGFRTRKILEAWHSKLTPNADNNSCPLPGQYNILFNKHS